MKLKKYIILLFTLVPFYNLGQKDTVSELSDRGKWLFYGKEKPDTILIQSFAKYSGHYVSYRTDSTILAKGMLYEGLKIGVWIHYFEDGETPMQKETYEDNILNGPFEKYYRNGILKESGVFVNDKRKGEVSMYYPSGCLQYFANYDDLGRENGIVRYYYDCDTESEQMIGQIEFEYTAESGLPEGKAKKYFEDGKIKEVIEYESGGITITTGK